MELPTLRITNHRGRPAFVWGSGSNKRHRVIRNPDDPAAVERQRLQILVELQGGDALKRRKIPLEQHIQDHLASVAGRAGENHLKAKEKKIRRVLEAANITRVEQINSTRIESAIRTLRDLPANPKKKPEAYPPLKQETRNHYRKAVKQFARWLWKKNRTETHLLLDLETETVRDDIKRVRFQPDEVTRLINAATESPRSVEGFDGVTRAWLYIIAVQTGFRRKELGALTADSFHLDSDPPTITLSGDFTKNKLDAIQPLRIMPALKEFLAARPPGEPIFPGLCQQYPRKTHKMIDNDMLEAVIPKVTAEGKRDFHSLRNSYISHLADLGLAVHEVQRLARNSDIKTTQGYMTPTADLAKRAARLLPDLPVPNATS